MFGSPPQAYQIPQTPPCQWTWNYQGRGRRLQKPLVTFSGCDGQFASSDKRHDVGVVGVCRIKRNEVCYAVDVTANAADNAAKISYILRVGVHGHSSATAEMCILYSLAAAGIAEIIGVA